MSRGPGRWQSMVLRLIAERPDGFVLLWEAEREAGRALTRAEYSAVMRAADQLVKRGDASYCYVWVENAGGQRNVAKWIAGPEAPRPASAAGGTIYGKEWGHKR
jgi:hypothetical protein